MYYICLVEDDAGRYVSFWYDHCPRTRPGAIVTFLASHVDGTRTEEIVRDFALRLDAATRGVSPAADADSDAPKTADARQPYCSSDPPRLEQ